MNEFWREIVYVLVRIWRWVVKRILAWDRVRSCCECRHGIVYVSVMNFGEDVLSCLRV